MNQDDAMPLPVQATQSPSARPHALHVGALCDFVDEASGCDFPITVDHLSSLVGLLARAGVTTLSWAHYADDQGGPLLPATSNAHRTYQHLGNAFARAVVAAHAEGLRIFGYFKPYEMAVDQVFPEGSPEARESGIFDRIGGKVAWADPFVAANPQYCIQHRNCAFPEPNRDEPVGAIKLFKSDDGPTRIQRENLQIWSSPDNYRYQQLPVEFGLSESFETAESDAHTLSRGTVTRAGDRIRVLTLKGLNLTDRYILVTTDFANGKSDFANASTRILRMYDRNGREIPGCFANGKPIYNADRADFRHWGLMFDTGYGLRTCTLDDPNASGRDGLIAFTRGRSPHLGAPCETEPQVQEYWLDRVEQMLDDGADGIELRIENHSTHTDFPAEYGFNQAVLDRLADPAHPTLAQIAKVRGDAYTEFLGRAKERIAGRGREMRLNFELDALRPDPPPRRLLAYPANMEMQWQRWLDLGLPDEVVFRHYGLSFDDILQDEPTDRIAAACLKKGIPIHFNRYIRDQEADRILRDVDAIRDDPRFSGYVFYEVCSYIQYHPDGTCAFRLPTVPKAMRLAGTPSNP